MQIKPALALGNAWPRKSSAGAKDEFQMPTPVCSRLQGAATTRPGEARSHAPANSPANPVQDPSCLLSLGIEQASEHDAAKPQARINNIPANYNQVLSNGPLLPR